MGILDNFEPYTKYLKTNEQIIELKQIVNRKTMQKIDEFSNINPFTNDSDIISIIMFLDTDRTDEIEKRIEKIKDICTPYDCYGRNYYNEAVSDLSKKAILELIGYSFVRINEPYVYIEYI
ncbi:MAG: hypothetical protein HFJ50_01915 [Clostridia bacterium]|nr:hypothetical protein [Clostridia bacterium]